MSTDTTQSLFDQLGGYPQIHRTVERFYDLMDTDPGYQALRFTHSEDLQLARQKLTMFLTGWTGGPPLYENQFGHPRLRARHMPFSIGILERDQWLHCMDRAMQDTGVPDALRERLNAAFFQTADWMRNR